MSCMKITEWEWSSINISKTGHGAKGEEQVHCKLVRTGFKEIELGWSNWASQPSMNQLAESFTNGDSNLVIGACKSCTAFWWDSYTGISARDLSGGPCFIWCLMLLLVVGKCWFQKATTVWGCCLQVRDSANIWGWDLLRMLGGLCRSY